MLENAEGEILALYISQRQRICKQAKQPRNYGRKFYGHVIG